MQVLNISLMLFETTWQVSLSYCLSQFYVLLFNAQALTTLDLDQNQIGDVGAQHLADALRNNTVSLILFSSLSRFYLLLNAQVLTTFYLSNNQIGATGAQYLADVLQNNTVRLILFLYLSFLCDGILDNQADRSVRRE